MSENTERRPTTDPAVRPEAERLVEEVTRHTADRVADMSKREVVAMAVLQRCLRPESRSEDANMNRIIRHCFTVADAFLAESDRDRPPA